MPVPSPRPRRWTKLASVSAAVAIAVVVAIDWPPHKGVPKAPPEHPVTDVPPSPPPSVGEVAYTVSVGFSKSTGGGDLPLSADAHQARRPHRCNHQSVRPALRLRGRRGRSRRVLLVVSAARPVEILPPNVTNELPGRGPRDKRHWQVTSRGDVSTSLSTQVRRESVPSKTNCILPSPVEGRPVTSARLSDATLGRLRGVGGLVPARSGKSKVHYLFETADPLTAQVESARGIWLRQLTLQNP